MGEFCRHENTRKPCGSAQQEPGLASAFRTLVTIHMACTSSLIACFPGKYVQRWCHLHGTCSGLLGCPQVWTLSWGQEAGCHQGAFLHLFPENG